MKESFQQIHFYRSNGFINNNKIKRSRFQLCFTKKKLWDCHLHFPPRFINMLETNDYFAKKAQNIKKECITVNNALTKPYLATFFKMKCPIAFVNSI